MISFRLKGAGVSGYAGGAKNEAALRLPFFQTSDGLFGTNPEEINLRDDHSALLLDERVLSGAFVPDNATSAKDCTDPFIRWLYMEGPDIEETLVAWRSVKHASRSQRRLLLDILEVENKFFLRNSQHKREHEKYKRPVVNVENLLVTENRSLHPQTYESILLMRWDELTAQLGAAEGRF